MVVESRLRSLLLKRNFLFLTLVAAEFQQSKKGILTELPGAVGGGISKSALGRSSGESQVREFTPGYGQTIAAFTQALGPGQLAEEHSDILTPAGESLGVTFRPPLVRQP